MKKITIFSLLVLAVMGCRKTTSVLPSIPPQQLILGNWALKKFEIKQFKGATLIKDSLINPVGNILLNFMNNDSVTITNNLGTSTISSYGLIDNQVLLIGNAQFHINTLNTNQLSYLFSTTLSHDTITENIHFYAKN